MDGDGSRDDGIGSIDIVSVKGGVEVGISVR